MTESWPEAAENQGRSAAELRADERLHRLDRFHTLHWPEEDLRDGHEWWRVGAETRRCVWGWGGWGGVGGGV